MKTHDKPSNAVIFWNIATFVFLIGLLFIIPVLWTILMVVYSVFGFVFCANRAMDYSIDEVPLNRWPKLRPYYILYACPTVLLGILVFYITIGVGMFNKWLNGKSN